MLRNLNFILPFILIHKVFVYCILKCLPHPPGAHGLKLNICPLCHLYLTTYSAFFSQLDSYKHHRRTIDKRRTGKRIHRYDTMISGNLTRWRHNMGTRHLPLMRIRGWPKDCSHKPPVMRVVIISEMSAHTNGWTSPEANLDRSYTFGNKSNFGMVVEIGQTKKGCITTSLCSCSKWQPRCISINQYIYVTPLGGDVMGGAFTLVLL